MPRVAENDLALDVTRWAAKLNPAASVMITLLAVDAEKFRLAALTLRIEVVRVAVNSNMDAASVLRITFIVSRLAWTVIDA